MRKLIVSNLVSLDGYYEGKDRNLDALFDYFHEDYSGDDHFDYDNTEWLRAADTLLLSGRTSFLGNKAYCSLAGTLHKRIRQSVCATRVCHLRRPVFG